MADTAPAVASAVIVPETEEVAELSFKRRHSSLSDPQPKRRRLSQGDENYKSNAASPPRIISEQPKVRQTETDKAEERKRGRRLFGALLGTLSQSSSSTAQKRRTEIDRKQQAKLRQQDEEQDEANKERLEALTSARKREQKIYDRQTARIRHSNLLAQAHFLQTKSEPRLFYKPWELLPKEEEQIKEQVKDTQALLNSDLVQLEETPSVKGSKESSDLVETQHDAANGQTVGKGDNTNEEISSGPDTPQTITNDEKHSTNDKPTKLEPQESSKDQVADGEEVLEGDEDTVIY